MTSNIILSGVYVENLALSGKTTKEVELLLEPLYSKVMQRKIMISCGGKTWIFLIKQLGVRPAPKETIKQVWEVGRKGDIWQRMDQRWQAKVARIHLPLVLHIDEKIIEKTIGDLAKSMEIKPQNAQIEIIGNNKIKIVPGLEGRTLDFFESKKVLIEGIKNFEESEVELVVKIVPPNLTTQDVKNWRINGIVASYATKFDANNINRSYNIKVAAEALDNKLIMPREVFSFNDVVGQRTKEAGYKESLVIENNEFTPGIGGGVCQVSSTLYNAVLRANLSIVERHHHSLPIKYVPLGLDATVAYDWADLKFANDNTKPILIHTEYRPGTLQIIIFGTVGENPRVNISSKVLKIIDPEQEFITDNSLSPGVQLVEQKGKKGMKVEVKREIIMDGEAVSSEIISRDTYKSQKSVIRKSP